MPDGRRAICKTCGKHRDEVGLLSWNGNCRPCWHRLKDEACDDLHYHRGPVFLEWRRAHAAAVGAVLVDDLLRAE